MRVRITVVATIVVAVALGLAGLALVWAQERALTASLEESLASDAAELAGRLEAGTLDLDEPLVVSGDDDAFAQVVGPGGEVVGASPVAPAEPLAPRAPAGVVVEERSVPGLDEGAFLVVSRPADGSVVHVGAPVDDIAESVRTLVRSLVLTAPVVVAVLALLVWLLVGRTLRPVEEIRAEVGEIGATGLHRRVPVPGTGDEVADLARTMNEMLDRIEHGVERQRRFIDDASHELRSPLTRIRSELEVDLAHPAGADPQATHRSVLEEVDGLQALVDDLLLLARRDAGGRRTDEPVDLAELVVEEVHRGARAPGEGPTVAAAPVEAATVRGDPGQLGRVVRNLLDNAVRHATSAVAVALRVEGDEAVLVVTDDGPGIPAERVEEAFERFTRLDEARSADDGGTGLGLAIVRDVVEGHGGSVTIDPEHRSGARLVVRLPLASDPG